MKVLVLLALIGTAMAVPKSITRIVGGSPTTIDRYPYMSNMQYAWFGVWWAQACGGSLITANSVLSAAHCYEGDPASLWRVRLGSSLSSSGGTLHLISQLVLHPAYSSRTLDADVAIIRLSTPAQFSSTVAAARIPSATYFIQDGRVATAIGWGSLTTGGSSPEQLHHVDVNVINQELCAQRYAFLKTQPGFQNWPDVTPSMLCAGILDVGGKDACQGDSGGPLAVDGNIVIGVTSWGFRCADPFYPGVNARVSSFTNWIAATA